MRIKTVRMTILLAKSFIWGTRLMLLFIISFKLGQNNIQKNNHVPSQELSFNNHPETEALMHQVLSKTGPNPLSGLHQWIINTETTLKTLPIKDKDSFLKKIDAMKIKFAKLVQISITKMNNSDKGPLFKGSDADIFYKGIEALYKEKSGLEQGINLNIETYGFKV